MFSEYHAFKDIIFINQEKQEKLRLERKIKLHTLSSIFEKDILFFEPQFLKHYYLKKKKIVGGSHAVLQNEH